MLCAIPSSYSRGKLLCSYPGGDRQRESNLSRNAEGKTSQDISVELKGTKEAHLSIGFKSNPLPNHLFKHFIRYILQIQQVESKFSKLKNIGRKVNRALEMLGTVGQDIKDSGRCQFKQCISVGQLPFQLVFLLSSRPHLPIPFSVYSLFQILKYVFNEAVTYGEKVGESFVFRYHQPVEIDEIKS